MPITFSGNPSDYATLSEDADIVQNRTNAYKIITISDDIDTGLFVSIWGTDLVDYGPHIRVTIVKADGTRVLRDEEGTLVLVNIQPQKLKVYLDLTDVNQIGSLSFYPEFQMAPASWVQADRVVLTVIDDATAG